MASIWPVYGQCSQAVCGAALCHSVVTQSPGNTRQHPSYPPPPQPWVANSEIHYIKFHWLRVRKSISPSSVLSGVKIDVTGKYYQSTTPICSAVCMQISPVFAIASLRMAWCRLKYFKLVKVRTIYNLCKIFLHTSEVAEKTSKNTFHESSYTVPWIFCWGIEQSEWSRVIPVCL